MSLSSQRNVAVFLAFFVHNFAFLFLLYQICVDCKVLINFHLSLAVAIIIKNIKGHFHVKYSARSLSHLHFNGSFTIILALLLLHCVETFTPRIREKLHPNVFECAFSMSLSLAGSVQRVLSKELLLLLWICGLRCFGYCYRLSHRTFLPCYPNFFLVPSCHHCHMRLITLELIPHDVTDSTVGRWKIMLILFFFNSRDFDAFQQEFLRALRWQQCLLNVEMMDHSRVINDRFRHRCLHIITHDIERKRGERSFRNPLFWIVIW